MTFCDDYAQHIRTILLCPKAQDEISNNLACIYNPYTEAEGLKMRYQRIVPA